MRIDRHEIVFPSIPSVLLPEHVDAHHLAAFSRAVAYENVDLLVALERHLADRLEALRLLLDAVGVRPTEALDRHPVGRLLRIDPLTKRGDQRLVAFGILDAVEIGCGQRLYLLLLVNHVLAVPLADPADRRCVRLAARSPPLGARDENLPELRPRFFHEARPRRVEVREVAMRTFLLAFLPGTRQPDQRALAHRGADQRVQRMVAVVRPARALL